MDELERAFRDALKRADTVTVPVSVDPEEVRGSRPLRPRWLGGLAIAAGLAVVAGVGVWAVVGRGVPAVPAAAPSTMVEVDAFSGRENPTVPLAARLADQLYDALPGLEQTGLELTDLPDPGLGFRGFVVTPPDGTRPVLRITPGTVVVDPGGDPEILADAGGSLFNAVLGGLPEDLQQLVLGQMVQIRIRNAGEVELAGITVTFPDNLTVDYGTVPAGGASRYAPVGLAYRYALIIATADGQQHRWRPIDYMGETLLKPGYYSYAISVSGDQIDLAFEVDEAGPTATQPQTEPSPADTPQAPPPVAQGDTATWVLLDPAAVGPESTELTVGVTRLGCASGVTGAVLDPQVEITDEQVVVTIDVDPLPQGQYECQGNDTVEYVVTLAEPLGDRDLMDGACLAGEAVGTAACVDGAVRRVGPR